MCGLKRGRAGACSVGQRPRRSGSQEVGSNCSSRTRDSRGRDRLENQREECLGVVLLQPASGAVSGR